ncbi:hypothetical protein BJV77DRAFT_140778 [Russula vinacea]|nr:hypothetical protein BJV77DRAFT_140778 [Russula vinacea]
MLPISNVDFLSISAADMDDSVNWVELFKHLSKVTTIQVIGRGQPASCGRSLLQRPQVRSPTGKGRKRDVTTVLRPGHTSAPADAPFSQTDIPGVKSLDFGEGPPSGVLFNVVQRGLQQRKAAAKAPMEVLRIDNCVISAKRAKALQKLVRQFHWDGDEGFVDEFEDFGDYDSDFDEGRGGRTFLLGLRRLSGSGGRTIRMGGERVVPELVIWCVWCRPTLVYILTRSLIFLTTST